MALPEVVIKTGPAPMYEPKGLTLNGWEVPGVVAVCPHFNAFKPNQVTFTINAGAVKIEPYELAEAIAELADKKPGAR